MQNNFKGWGLGIFILLLLILVVSTMNGDNNTEPVLNQTEVEKDNFIVESSDFANPLNDIGLVDNNDIYSLDQDDHLDRLYVTTFSPRKKDAVTFEKLNNNNYRPADAFINDASDIVVEAYFEVGKPSLNIEGISPNATIELRGQSSRRAAQKSYKIKLYDNTESWLGFRNINLNKHFSDKLRIRNKLSFDYFEVLEDFISLRTRFVRLYVRDLAAANSDFVDYGLFTFIEKPNKGFLERHKLDRNGHLYKAENFEFYRYQDSIKLKTDITYSQEKFERRLETEGNDDHQKLIEMLEAVNNYSLDINQVVEKHFDRDNLLSWVAVNILFNNYDSNSRNFLLYSPLNSQKWFFIPWDYDGAWGYYKKSGLAKWQQGIANYWGMVLFNRFFKDYRNVEDLNKKLKQLLKTINPAYTRRLLDRYYSLVKDNIYMEPDSKYLKMSIDEYKQEYYSLVDLPEQRLKKYFNSLEDPLPFFLGEPVYNDGKYLFNWSLSYDHQGDDLSYKFILSRDHNFEDIVITYNDLKMTNCSVEDLEAGEYYWKVLAFDSKGNWQQAFDYHKSDGKKYLFGVKKLIVRDE